MSSRNRRTPLYARHSRDLLADLERWQDVLAAVLAAPHGQAAFAALLRYALRVGDVQPEPLHRLVRRLGPVAEEAYVTTEQQLIERGRTEGRVEGRAEGRAELLLKQLDLRFGTVPTDVVDRLRGASASQLDLWAERVLTATSLDDVLR